MKITLPIDGVIQTIPVPFRIWLATKLFVAVEWLVAPEYVADLNLVPKAPVAAPSSAE